MKKHILLENAYRYPEPQGTLAPDNCTFSGTSGYWVEDSSGQAMMLSDNPKRPETKKADRETGEDQKGE